jgi:DNA polymerase (family 10)
MSLAVVAVAEVQTWPGRTTREIPSIGPVRARLIQERLGISTVSELERAACEHRLRALPGIGETLEARIADEAAQARKQSRRAEPIPAT